MFSCFFKVSEQDLEELHNNSNFKGRTLTDMQLTVLKSITSQVYEHVKIRSVFDHFHLSQQANIGPIYFHQNTCSLVGQLLLQFQLQCPEKKRSILD